MREKACGLSTAKRLPQVHHKGGTESARQRPQHAVAQKKEA
jgi:hypothetical protein